MAVGAGRCGGGPAVSLGTPTPEMRLVKERSHEQVRTPGPRGDRTARWWPAACSPAPSGPARPAAPAPPSGPPPAGGSRPPDSAAPWREASTLPPSSSTTSSRAAFSPGAGGEKLGGPGRAAGEGSRGTLTGRIRASAEYREGRQGGDRGGHSGLRDEWGGARRPSGSAPGWPVPWGGHLRACLSPGGPVGVPKALEGLAPGASLPLASAPVG